MSHFIDHGKKRIFIAVPTYDGKLTSRAAQTIYTESTIHEKMTLVARSSLLCQTMNALWCAALNRRGDGITHFAMLHADIEPDGFWIDTMIGEMDRTGADVLSAVSPLKNNQGLTSTAIQSDDNRWRHRRLTMAELLVLPETFEASDVPWSAGRPLLVNTGCIVCRFDQPWVERVCFHIEDDIARNSEGAFEPRVFSEDWNFSRWANNEGLKVMATTKVRLTHIGDAPFPNYGKWGQETDDAIPEETPTASLSI